MCHPCKTNSLHWSESGNAVLFCNTSRSATHIAYLRVDAITCVARGGQHGSFALERREGRDQRRINKHSCGMISPMTPWIELKERTFGNVMPPRRIKRIVLSPTCNGLPICLASGIFERITRSMGYLRIERRKGRDITRPPAYHSHEHSEYSTIYGICSYVCASSISNV